MKNNITTDNRRRHHHHYLPFKEDNDEERHYEHWKQAFAHVFIEMLYTVISINVVGSTYKTIRQDLKVVWDFL